MPRAVAPSPRNMHGVNFLVDRNREKLSKHKMLWGLLLLNKLTAVSRISSESHNIIWRAYTTEKHRLEFHHMPPLPLLKRQQIQHPLQLGVLGNSLIPMMGTKSMWDKDPAITITCQFLTLGVHTKVYLCSKWLLVMQDKWFQSVKKWSCSFKVQCDTPS